MENSYINKMGKGMVATFLACLCLGIVLTMQAQNVAGKKYVKQCLAANQPVGIAKGIFPGRVVWSHAPGAARWQGEGLWFEDRWNNQAACDWMVRNTVCTLTGEKTPKKAWNCLFCYFNGRREKGLVGYRSGERIAVKINNNNTYSHADSEEINASPQMVLALLRSLVNEAGVPQQYITIAEPSRFITDYLYKKLSEEFPKVHYVDNAGGDGREKTGYVQGAMAYSKDNGELAKGISTAFTEADYVINMALLKGHVGQGVTLCGKNWYGTMSIHADWRKNYHNNFDQSRNGKSKYLTFVDFMGHKDLGGKCLLWLVDGLYGSRSVDGKPSSKWTLSPFNGAWPCSLLGSLDPVAIDMVGLDLLTSQFPDMPDVDFSDMYLWEAALAGSAPSGTKYDPEGDGSHLGSLGVAEHWNNARDKKYSRNLGKNEGIELVYRRR